MTVCSWSSNARLPSRKSKISQFSWGISRRHPPFLSSSFENLRVDREQWWLSQQNGCAREEIFLYLYNVGHFNVDFKSSYTLDNIAHLFRSPFIHCMVLLCVQYNVKLCCLFSGWFAKEANVANNKQRLANCVPQSQRRTGRLWMLRDRKWCQTCNLEGWRPRIQEHTISSLPIHGTTSQPVSFWAWAFIIFSTGTRWLTD
jgi:hypothetical protein